MKFTISYENSSPSLARAAYYYAIAESEGFTLERVEDNADITLLNGRENYHELKSAGYSVIISKIEEKRIVALFAPDSLNKQTLKLAGNFEWQCALAVSFLKKYLPASISDPAFETIINDRSAEQCIADLNNGAADIILCPLADLDLTNTEILKSMKYMVLPLFECPPGIYQGCTGIYFKDSGSAYIDSLVAASEKLTNQFAKVEESLLSLTATDNFGIFSLDLPLVKLSYIKTTNDGIRDYWKWDINIPYPAGKKLFSTTDFMKDFFRYEYSGQDTILKKPVAFIASHKAVREEKLVNQLSKIHVWAAGTRTWRELARKGIWVEGCADGIGLEALAKTWSGKFLHIAKPDVEILTNEDSAAHWIEDGWSATSTYRLIPALTQDIIEGLKSAEIIFWTSYQQYEACKQYLQPSVIHACPAGKTAVLLRREGIEPIIFPTIQAFKNSPPRQAGAGSAKEG